MSAETITYNVYHVKFTQISPRPDHEAIALVPAQLPDQGAGRFYHVKGTVGMGMDYEAKPGFRFAMDGTFKSSDLQFQIAKRDLGRFEAIAEGTSPPHDPRALTEKSPDPPLRDCSAWVAEVLEEVKKELH